MSAPATDARTNLSPLGERTIEIAAPAKVNLLLKITGQRADGYHELLSVFVPVALFDHLRISRSKGVVAVYCRGRELPDDQSNLVSRAAASFFDITGIRKGAKITLIKRIPIASGLGGGSSDAAATLKGLNRLWGNPLPQKVVERVALSLGADVPFFLVQRPAFARGIGEILEPIEDFPDLWYVIVSPKVMVSTAWAYKNAKFELTEFRKKNIVNWFDGPAVNIPDLLFNDLESATLSKHPILCSIKASLIELGALGALMTGSGPSIFGIFDSSENARQAGKALARQWKETDVFVVRGLP